MQSLLQWLTGEKLPPGEVQSTFSLQGISPGWALLLFLVGTAAIIGSYRAFTPEISKSRRVLLAALRVASFALILIFLLKPVLSLRIEEPVRSALLVLFDNSRSMQIEDERPSAADRANAKLLAGEETPARSALVKALAKNTTIDLFPKLAEVADLKFESFGSQRSSLGEPTQDQAAAMAAEAIAALTFDEESTALGDAITETLTQWRGTPISGVLLVTDGASNAGSDPLAASSAAVLDRVPLFIYGTGVAELRDLRVVDITVPPVSFMGETLEVRTTTKLLGYPAGTSVRLTLRSGDKVLGEKTLNPTSSDSTETVFQFVPDTAGPQELVVQADPLEGEIQTENNKAATSVRIVDQKVKLLYIAQRPGWDFRYITNTLKDDRRVELKCHVIEGERNIPGEEGKIFLDAFPDATALLDYQVILLGDVDPADLGKERMDSLVKMVSDTSGGLVFLAGPDFNPAAYKSTPLESLLPVDLDPVTDPAAYALRSTDLIKLTLTPAGQDSPLLKLADSGPESLNLWKEFKGVRWVARHTRQKPTAETLATSGVDLPVVATQTFGRGQTLYFGTDETYRWRSKIGAKHFIRIWTQIIQSFALERLQGASDKIQLRPDKPVVFVGDVVNLSGRVFDEDFKPLNAARLEGEWVREGTTDAPQPFALDLSPETPGLYAGKWTPRRPGSYAFVPFRDRKAVTRLEVRSRDNELLNLAMEKNTLTTLATTTKGRFLTEADLATLPDLLKTTSATIPRRKTIDLYALWPLLVLAILLLSSEWTLRRLSRLK